MSEYKLSEQPLDDWDTSDLAQYLRENDLHGYSQIFRQHQITGDVADRLDEDELKEMGIDVVGERLKIMETLETFRKAKELQDRERLIWTGEEVVFYSGCHKCYSTCCGCCPVDPAQYKLMAHHMEIITPDPCRCGPIRCCFGNSYEIDNVDLSDVMSADVEGLPPPCLYQVFCCSKTREHVKLQTKAEGIKTLILLEGDGQKAARRIKNQVETMQILERS